MSEWQEQTPVQETIRTRWTIMLSQALEQIEEKFIMGSIDRETYYAELAELNDKLGIIGLSLSSKPWVKVTSSSNRV